MHPRPSRPARAAFTLIELLVVIAIIALLVSILLPAIGKARKLAKSSLCTSNIRQFTLATLNYATDNREFLTGYVPPEPNAAGQRVIRISRGEGVPPDVATPTNDFAWASFRGFDLINRLSAPAVNLTPTDNFAPYVNYSHLPLVGYLAQRLPEPSVLCPDDRLRRNLQETFRSTAGAGSSSPSLAPFSSSYAYTLYAFYPDRGGVVPGSHHNAITQPPLSSNVRAGRRRISEVVSPSRKVSWNEGYARHTTRAGSPPAYFQNIRAQPIASFFDGSVRFVNTADATIGGYTNAGGLVISPIAVPYIRDQGIDDEPWTNGQDNYTGPEFRGHIRWTVGGLKGSDFTGK